MHLHDKHESQQEQLVVFVDLENAYDTVPREDITSIVRHSAVPEQYVALVEDIYSGSQVRVQANHGLTENFSESVGLHQGSVLSQYLFTLCLDESKPADILFAYNLVITAGSANDLEL